MLAGPHSETLGLMCGKCGCYHDETYALHHETNLVLRLRALCQTFDPGRLCDLCCKPVEQMSMGGPTICPWCDAAYNRDGTKKN